MTTVTLAGFHALNYGMFELARNYRERETTAYAELRSVSIGPSDLVISAAALEVRATLVTANTRHFEHVPGLAVENWR